MANTEHQVNRSFSHPLTSAKGRTELAGTVAASSFWYQVTTKVKSPRNFRLTRTVSQSGLEPYPLHGAQCQQFLSIAKDNFLDQVVTDPARITETPETSSTTLDLFFTNNATLVNQVHVITGISDHEAIFIESSLRPMKFVCLFDLILYVPSTIFQLNRDGSSWVEPVLSWDKCVLLKDHNAVTPVRLELAAPRSRVKHSTTEPLSFFLSLLVRSYMSITPGSANLEILIK